MYCTRFKPHSLRRSVSGSRQRGDSGVDGPDAARLLCPALLQALEEELPRHQPAPLLRIPLPEGGGPIRARGE